MSDLAAQLATASCSIINFVYGGIAISTMLALTARRYRRSTCVQRFPAALLTLGSIFRVALCLAVIVMDIAHLTGHLELMYAVQPAYGPLLLLTFLFLCAGLAVKSAVRRAQHHARRRGTAALTTEPEPLWRRAIRVRPGLSQADPSPTTAKTPKYSSPEWIAEIRDAMIDPTSAPTTATCSNAPKATS